MATFDTKVNELMTEIKDFKLNKPDALAKVANILDTLSKVKECGDRVQLLSFSYPTRLIFLDNNRKDKLGLAYCDDLYKRNKTNPAALINVLNEETPKGEKKFIRLDIDEVTEKIGPDDLEAMATIVIDEQINHYKKLNRKISSTSELQDKANNLEAQIASHDAPVEKAG